MLSENPTRKNITVALIEDSEIVSRATTTVLNSSGQFICNQVYQSAEDALVLIPANPVDVVLVDILLPGISGIECVAQLSSICPNTHFVMFTVCDDDDHLFEALKAGAIGYLLKDTMGDELIAALRDLYMGGSPMSAVIARKVVKAFHHRRVKEEVADSLTDREKQLLKFLSDGLMYKEIADKLSISLETVKKHCQNIYKKMQVHCRTEAVNKAFIK